MIFSNRQLEQLCSFLILFDSSSSNCHETNGPKNQTNKYEQHYQKNLDCIKVKYKNLVSAELSLQKVSECTAYLLAQIPQNEQDMNVKKRFSIPEVLRNKIYCFLSALAFYEIDSNLMHYSFVINLYFM